MYRAPCQVNPYASQPSTLASTERWTGAVSLNTAPMFHVGGAGISLQLMIRPCKQVVMPVFNEGAFLQAIERERTNATFLAPTMLKRLIELPRFRRCPVWAFARSMA